jgi:hypothetical protein
MLLAELRRAVAAQQRYEELKRLGTVAGDGGPRPDIARRIFEEFYSSGSAGAVQAGGVRPIAEPIAHAQP